MKHYTLYILACAMLVAACRPSSQTNDNGLSDYDTNTSSEPDTTIWGRLGEGTGMSALEFITDDDDTLEIYRSNPTDGTDGNLMGQIRNATDKFAMTLQSDGETMLTAINSTQLLGTWRCNNGTITIHPGGVISSDSLSLEWWKLWNGHILLGQKQRTEYGDMHRVDTMDIIRLSSEELIIRNAFGEETRYTPEL